MELWQTTEFKRWWDEDWSWEGLATKFKKRALSSPSELGETTLQALWASQRNALFELGGRKWTRFHLPPFTPEGQACEAGVWNRAKVANAFDELLRNLPTNSTYNLTELQRGVELTNFSDLRGLVFNEKMLLWGRQHALAGDFGSTIFLDNASFPANIVTLFSNAIFCKEALFREVTVHIPGDMRGAAFFADSDFSSSTFRFGSDFSGAVSKGLQKFSGTNFYGATTFDEAHLENAAFDGGSFHGDVSFTKANITNLRFSNQTFSSHADLSNSHIIFSVFRQCKFAEANLSRAEFGRVKFISCQTSDDFDLSGATFNGDASFEESAFMGLSLKGATFKSNSLFRAIKLKGELTFTEVTSQGLAAFKHSEFAASDFSKSDFREADFSDSIWSGTLNFSDSRFAGTITFRGSQTTGELQAIKTKFNGLASFNSCKLSRIRFTGAEFFEACTFSDADFGNASAFSNAIFHSDADFSGKTPFASTASFSGAHFQKRVNFSNRKFTDTTDFSGAIFEGTPKFEGAFLHEDTTFSGSKFNEGPAPLRASWLSTPIRTSAFSDGWLTQYKSAAFSFRRIPPLLSLRWPGMRQARLSQDRATEQFETAYRTLKRLCANIGNHEYEAKFNALELRAKRARSDQLPIERFLSFAYDKISNYGQSVQRPITALLFGWVVAAALYLSFLMPPYSRDFPGLNCTNISMHTLSYLNLFGEVFVAVGRQFLPSLFSPISGAITAPDWLRCAAASHPVLFFAIGIAQTAFFLSCAGLFLIALRRRFRIAS